MSTETQQPENDYSVFFSSYSARVPDGKASSRHLARVLSQDFSAVRKMFWAACTPNQRETELSEPMLWLTDHYDDMEEEQRLLQKRFRSVLPLSSCGGVPYVYAAVCAVLESFAESACHAHADADRPPEPLFDAILLYCDRTVPAGLSFEEIGLYSSFLSAAILSRIGEICRGKEPNNLPREDGEKLVLYTKLFCAAKRYCPHDAEEQCRAEALLLADPSGAYPRMTKSSRASLKRKIGLSARRSGLPDTAVIRNMAEKAEKGKTEKERYIGHYVPSGKPPRAAYFAVLSVLTLVGAVFFSRYSRPYLFLLLLFPVGEAAHFLTDTLFSRFYRHDDTLPELALAEIPPNGKTLCVITSLLTGEKNDASLFSSLERIYNANSGDNIYFGILADLPDSRSAVDARDDRILDHARRRIDALCAKYGDVFFLFVRPRRYSKGEQVFMAHERKRGAVIELVRFIKGEPTCIEVYGKENGVFRPDNIRYVITLDADTNLGLCAAKRLVSKMLHPENRPILHPETQTVTDGYGIMQPHMGTELASARATAFSRLFCEGGIELYSSASFSLYQSLFSVGNFCGKGILDVDAFYETICKADIFPNDTVLSHDILEGERLRTASLCDLTLTDGFPKHELSYLKRKNRWIRGDVQNLLYLGSKIKIGKTVKKHFYGAVSRYKLLDNVRRALVPIFSFALLFAAFFLKDCRSFLTLCAFLPYIIPFLADLVRAFTSLTVRCASRKFFSSGVTVSLWQSFLRMLFCGSMLAKDALMSCGAVLTSLYRLFFSHKKLLEWTTAACSDSGKTTLTLFLSKHLLSCAVGVFFFAAVPHGLLKAAGLCFFLFPLFAALFSREKKSASPLSDKNEKKLRLYARDIWKFFESTVTASENFLPPDNIQLSPYEKTAHRTSPTNIGLYLTGVLCARDLDFIDSDELCDRVRKTLDTVFRLEKYHGNLYNWYDTSDRSVLSPRYVSSVDSGNFVACLITLKQGLSDYADENPFLLEQIARIGKLIEESDLSVLYDPKRNLFRVGISVTDGAEVPDRNHYDYLMSESRILSYIAVSRKLVPPEHWNTLSRPLISSHRYIGLASWSGTAFEYFMPALFMPPQKGSLQYEALIFAEKAQRARRFSGAWGISESAYFAFDCDLNYQYKAFGIPILGMRNDLQNDAVLSPYSAYLALCAETEKVLSNLAVLSELGLYGKFGLFEACDFTESRTGGGYAPVKSYMAHHMGMSLAAIGNTLCGGMARRFMRDEKSACAYELLEEKIPVNAVIRKRKRTYIPPIKREKAFSDPITEIVPSPSSPHFAALSDGKGSLVLSDLGHVRMTLGELSFFESEFCTFRRPDSVFAYVSTADGTIGLTPLAAPRNGSVSLSHSFSYCEGAAFYRTEENGVHHTLSFTLTPSRHSLLRIRYENDGDTPYPLCFFFSPLLFHLGRYDAHPAFSGLFVEAEFLPEHNILLYKRRPRGEGEEESFLAVGFADPTAAFCFETRKENLPSDIPKTVFEREYSNSVGACLSPAALFKTESVKEAELLLVLTHDRNEAIDAIEQARNEAFSDARNALSDAASSFVIGSGISSAGAESTVEKLLSAVCAPRTISEKKDGKDAEISRGHLWKHGISGDLPIYISDVTDLRTFAQIENLLRAFHLLIMKNVRLDLVILYEEYDRYDGRTKKKLMKAVGACGAQSYLNRKSGGIRLLEKTAAEEDLPTLYYAAVRERKVRSEKMPPELFRFGNTPKIPSDGFRVNGGTFSDGGFYVKKDEAETPFSHILAGENIGTVLTQNSLGYTFYKNASEMRITPYTGNPYREEDGETAIYESGKKQYDLAFCADKVFFAPGKAVYEGKIGRFSYSLTVTCCVKLPRKNISVVFSGADENDALYCRVLPSMGSRKEHIRAERRSPTMILFDNPLSEAFGQYSGFLFCRSDCIQPKIPDSDFLLCGGKITAESGEVCFGLGAFRNGTHADSFFLPEKRDYSSFARSLLPSVRFIPGNASAKSLALQKMFGTFYAYDAVFSRFLARSGYYQSGGAYGFRDQLQDALLLFYSDRKRALAHIYRAAAHQFPEGDVLHWWHGNEHRGIRTRCSDDLLWLVYVCLEYSALFGEDAFWNTPVPYLDGAPLPPEKAEEYAVFSKSTLREPLYAHCVRALKRALSQIGRHGLCKMGSCDWCDGYSLVGQKGDGESVWVSMFASHLSERFAETTKKKGDETLASELFRAAEELRKAVMQAGYDEKSETFVRGYYDDGKPLCRLSDSPFRLDVLPQAFAPYCSIGTTDMQYRALAVSAELLYDKVYRISKLLTPPFDSVGENPGYIAGYPTGIRENGGQYTHGALFFALGCFDCAEKLISCDREKARFLSHMGGLILFGANAAFRCSDAVSETVRSAYKTEPYAVAADIYANPTHMGRGGWTHYTGAAGWLYRLTLRYGFGLRFESVSSDPRLYIDPHFPFPFPDVLPGSSLHVKLFGYDLTVKYVPDEKTGLIIDGKPSDGPIVPHVRSVEVHYTL